MREFDMGIGEKLAGFYTKLEDKYFGVLDWLDAKGIPVYKYSDFLENHGIPSFPFTVAIIVLIIFLIFGFLTLGATINSSVIISAFDQFDNPLTDVRVNVKNSSGAVLLNTVTLDSGDAITLNAIPAGTEVTIYGEKDDYSPDSVTVPITKESQSVKLVLQGKATLINAKVMLEDSASGDPVKGARIIATYKTITRDIITDSTGTATIEQIPEATDILIEITADGYETISQNFQFTKDSVKTIQLSPKNASLSGKANLIVTIKDENGSNVTGALLKIIDNATQSELYKVTAEKSEYRAEVEKGLSIRLVVEKDGYYRYDSASSSENRTIRLDEEQWDVALKKGGKTLTVNVQSKTQEPLSEATVQIFDSNSNAMDSKQTAEAGFAEFNNLKEEKIFATAFKAGYLPERKEINLATESSTTITLTAADSSNSSFLAIYVTDSAGAIANNTDLFFYENAQGTKLPLGIPQMKTDLSGYATTRLKIGTEAIVDAKRGIESGTGQKTILANTLNELHIKMQKSASIFQLDVLNEDGTPAEGRITITSPDGTLLYDGNLNNGQALFDTQGKETANVEITTPDGKTYSNQLDLKGKNSDSITLGKGTSALAPDITLKAILDSKGNTVEAIVPGEYYWLEFETNWPSGNYKGGIHARIGSDDTKFVDSEEAAIYGYDATTTSFYAGRSYQPKPAPGNETADKQNKGTLGKENKLIELYFDNPKNTTIAKIKIKAKESIQSGSIEVHYRAWSEISGKFYRSPNDGTLDKNKYVETKTGLYAETYAKTIDITQASQDCEKILCASQYFLRKDGLIINPKDFKPVLNETYALAIDLTAQKATTATIKIETGTPAKLYFTGYDIDNFENTPQGTQQPLPATTDLGDANAGTGTVQGSGYFASINYNINKTNNDSQALLLAQENPEKLFFAQGYLGDTPVATTTTSNGYLGTGTTTDANKSQQNPYGFNEQATGQTTMSISDIDISPGTARKIRVYFKTVNNGDAYIKSTIGATGISIQKTFRFTIPMQKEFLVTVTPDEILTGKDFTINLKEKATNNPVPNAAIHLVDSKGNIASSIVGDNSKGKGLSGNYDYKNNFNPGIYKAEITAENFVPAEQEITIASTGLLQITSPIKISIPKGSTEATRAENIKNKSDQAITNLAYELDTGDNFPSEFNVSLELPQAIASKQSAPATIRVGLVLTDQSKETLHGEADLTLIGTVAGQFPTKTKTKLIIDYNKKFNSDCLKMDTSELRIKLIGVAGSTAQAQVEIENNCEAKVTLAPKIDSVEKDPNIQVSAQPVTIEANAKQAVPIKATNTIARMYAMQKTFSYKITFDSDQVTKSVPLKVELWNPVSNVAFPPQISLWLRSPSTMGTAGSIYGGSGYPTAPFPSTAYPGGVYPGTEAGINTPSYATPGAYGGVTGPAVAYDSRVLDIRNTGSYPITGFRLAVDDSGYRQYGIVAYLGNPGSGGYSPWADYGYLPPGGTLTPARSIIAQTSNRQMLAQPVLGYVHYTGIAMGRQQDFGKTTVSINYKGEQCLKLVAKGNVVFESKKTYGRQQQKITLRNDCSEGVRIREIRPNKIGNNTLYILPIETTIAPNSEQEFTMQMDISQAMNKTEQVRIYGWLVRTNTAIESNPVAVKINIGDIGGADSKNAKGPEGPKVKMKVCGTESEKEITFPKLGDCVTGYCDAKQFAQFLAKKINETIKTVKQETAKMQMRAERYPCANQSFCTFRDLGITPQKYTVYVQLDSLSPKMMEQTIKDIAEIDKDKYSVDKRTDIIDEKDLGRVAATGFNKQILLGEDFTGCGKYNIEIMGAAQVQANRIVEDSYMILVKADRPATEGAKARAETKECEPKIQNFANFLPVDEGITEASYEAWPGFVAYGQENLKLTGNEIAKQLFKSDRRNLQSVQNANNLQLALGGNEKSLVKIQLEQIPATDQPKTIHAYVIETAAEDQKRSAEIASALAAVRNGSPGKETCISEDETYMLIKSYEKPKNPLEISSKDNTIKISTEENSIELTVTSEIAEEVNVTTDFGTRTNQTGIEYIKITDEKGNTIYEQKPGQQATQSPLKLTIGKTDTTTPTNPTGGTTPPTNRTTTPTTPSGSTGGTARTIEKETGKALLANPTPPATGTAQPGTTGTPATGPNTGTGQPAQPGAGTSGTTGQPSTGTPATGTGNTTGTTTPTPTPQPVQKASAKIKLIIKGSSEYMLAPTNVPNVTVKAVPTDPAEQNRETKEGKQITVQVCGIHPEDLARKLPTLPAGTYYALPAWKGENTLNLDRLAAVVQDADQKAKDQTAATGGGISSYLPSFNANKAKKLGAIGAYAVSCSLAASFLPQGNKYFDCLLPAAWGAMDLFDSTKAAKTWIEDLGKRIVGSAPAQGFQNGINAVFARLGFDPVFDTPQTKAANISVPDSDRTFGEIIEGATFGSSIYSLSKGLGAMKGTINEASASAFINSGFAGDVANDYINKFASDLPSAEKATLKRTIESNIKSDLTDALFEKGKFPLWQYRKLKPGVSGKEFADIVAENVVPDVIEKTNKELPNIIKSASVSGGAWQTNKLAEKAKAATRSIFGAEGVADNAVTKIDVETIKGIKTKEELADVMSDRIWTGMDTGVREKLIAEGVKPETLRTTVTATVNDAIASGQIRMPKTMPELLDQAAKEAGYSSWSAITDDTTRKIIQEGAAKIQETEAQSLKNSIGTVARRASVTFAEDPVTSAKIFNALSKEVQAKMIPETQSILSEVAQADAKSIAAKPGILSKSFRGLSATIKGLGAATAANAVGMFFYNTIAKAFPFDDAEAQKAAPAITTTEAVKGADGKMQLVQKENIIENGKLYKITVSKEPNGNRSYNFEKLDPSQISQMSSDIKANPDKDLSKDCGKFWEREVNKKYLGELNPEISNATKGTIFQKDIVGYNQNSSVIKYWATKTGAKEEIIVAGLIVEPDKVKGCSIPAGKDVWDLEQKQREDAIACVADKIAVVGITGKDSRKISDFTRSTDPNWINRFAAQINAWANKG